MKAFYLLLLGCLYISFSKAQSSTYFQQALHYQIQVALNDKDHYLDGGINIQYTNNAPVALNEIYIHLWPNAYQDNTSALAQQMLRYGNTRYHFSKDIDRGGLSALQFKVDNRPVNWKQWQKHSDIVVLELHEPLGPGKSISISTPFSLKIPASFSRLGHIGQSYQMTQWYPKPAVYDKDGWHPMPYLDAGEFYSEFASFEVEITLPENYVVAATGVLSTSSEKDFLKEKVQESEARIKEGSLIREVPPSSPNKKTIKFTAEKVHDFAWFADKEFMVQHDTARLGTEELVDCWTFFTEVESRLWEEANRYVKQSVKFFSEEVGPYPYPQVTAVQSALSAGAGMEYPMITVIGESGTAKYLDEVIAHEVGHNWFYGILAFNERDEAWLDEGINSYYEKRYMAKYYAGTPSNYLVPEFFAGASKLSDTELLELVQTRRGTQQPMSTTSDSLSPINYLLNAYDRPSHLFAYLEAYLGKSEFDRIMQAFYQKWKFKHPNSKALKAFFEKESDKDLKWFFDDLASSTKKIDYKITGLKEEKDHFELELKNKGQIAAPIPVSGLIDNKESQMQWVEGFEGKKSIRFKKEDFESFIIDPNHLGLDHNRKNNKLAVGGLFPKTEALQVQLLPRLENGNTTQINLTPAFAWNNYDKWMPGVHMSNYGLPPKAFEFIISPFYGTATKELVGVGSLKYHFLPKEGALQKVQLSLEGRRFNFLTSKAPVYQLSYHKIVPKLQLEFRTAAIKNQIHRLELASNLIDQETVVFNDTGNFTGTQANRISVHSISYNFKNHQVLNRFSWLTKLENYRFNNPFQLESYWKLSSTYNSSILYKPNKRLHLRLFGGILLSASKDPGLNILPLAFDATVQGWTDFGFDHYFFGRTEQEGFLSRQIVIDEGGFKNAFGPGQRIGRSNNFLLAINLMSDLPMDLPLSLPLKPYIDLAYLDTGSDNIPDLSLDDPVFFSAGLALDLVHDRLAIYFPLVHSKNISDTYQGLGNFGTRISFTFNWTKLNLYDMLDERY